MKRKVIIVEKVVEGQDNTYVVAEIAIIDANIPIDNFSNNGVIAIHWDTDCLGDLPKQFEIWQASKAFSYKKLRAASFTILADPKFTAKESYKYRHNGSTDTDLEQAYTDQIQAIESMYPSSSENITIEQLFSIST